MTKITIKTPEDIEAYKKAGRLSAKVLLMAGRLVRPGITTREIDEYIEKLIRMNGGVPGFKGLYGFPGSACLSINEEIVHGIPGNRILQEGDILSVDTGATVNGWVGDNAFTFPVGSISNEKLTLLQVCRDSLELGIEQAVPGNHIGDIGHAVQTFAESHGFGVVRQLVGHGVGHQMHEEPSVPNFGRKGLGPSLREGMLIAIEPMITMGTHRIKELSDGWTVITKDKLDAAHFEKVVAVTKDGPVVMTDWDDPDLLKELKLSKDHFF